MSKYTTEVRFICETANGLTESVGYSKVNDVIAKALPVIFDFDFPIFDEKYRSVLETKILKHYYTREIGAESVGLWKLWLDTRLNEIMPYYNQLYMSELLEFNPLYDVDITRSHSITTNGTKDDKGTETGTRTTGGTGKLTGKTTTNGSSEVNENVNGENTSNNIKRDLYSDTPQGALTGVENETYLTNARKITDNGSTTVDETRTGTTNNQNIEDRITNNEYEETIGTNNATENKTIMQNTEEYLESVKGKQGSGNYSDMLLKYRETFLNIDVRIIEELSDLFMNIW